MKNICPPDNCTGCMSCAYVCTHKAINITEDPFGFLRPLIDEGLCTECGACARVCPELNRVSMSFPSSCFASSVLDQEQSNRYASGGVASAIAQNVIERGGIIVACCGNEITDVQHRVIRTTAQIEWMSGSKYVQSRITPELISEINTELKSGREVVFIGTGCQTAGIKNLFSKHHRNLILIDLVCHGVPSQKMLNENIGFYFRKFSDLDLSTIRFREKIDGTIIYGWFAETSGPKGMKITVPWKKDAYMTAFLDHLSLRPCCFHCRYAFSARATDLTLCDFWGLGDDCSLKGRNGVSAVLINSEKGLNLFNRIDTLENEKREIEEAVRGVGRLQTPSPCNPMVGSFNSLYLSNGLQTAVSETSFKKFKREKLRSTPVLGTFLRVMSRFVR